MFNGYFGDLYWLNDYAILPSSYFDVSSLLKGHANNESEIKIGSNTDLTGNGAFSAGGCVVNHADLGLTSYTYASAEHWNQFGYKTITVESNDNLVTVNNFVEVNIKTDSTAADVYVNDAKRGSITTADFDDTIFVDIYSNNELAGNTFTVHSQGGDDTITVTESLHSQYTSLDIDAGSGFDKIDLTDLADPASEAVTRTVDGGDDIDVLLLSGHDSVTFENIELVRGVDDASLTLTSELLANNDTYGDLILGDVDLSFDGSIAGYSINTSLGDSHYTYLKTGLDQLLGYYTHEDSDGNYVLGTNPFYELTVTTVDGADYTIVANDWTLIDPDTWSEEPFTIVTPAAYEDHVTEPTTTFLAVNEWNKAGYKNAVVDNNDDTVIVDNYVDVSITNNNSDGADIFVHNAKRGEITTGNASSDISVSAYSNNALGDNTFHITTGWSKDVITLTDAYNSQYTGFDINSGAGNDVVDVSGLNAANSSDVARFVTAGNNDDYGDFDTLIIQESASLEFAHFECIRGVDDASLTLSETLLKDNKGLLFDNEGHSALVVENVDIFFDDSITAYEVDSLSARAVSRLEGKDMDAEDFIQVTVTTEDSAYYVLTNDHDFVVADFS